MQFGIERHNRIRLLPRDRSVHRIVIQQIDAPDPCKEFRRVLRMRIPTYLIQKKLLRRTIIVSIDSPLHAFRNPSVDIRWSGLRCCHGHFRSLRLNGAGERSRRHRRCNQTREQDLRTSA